MKTWLEPSGLRIGKGLLPVVGIGLVALVCAVQVVQDLSFEPSDYPLYRSRNLAPRSRLS